MYILYPCSRQNTNPRPVARVWQFCENPDVEFCSGEPGSNRHQGIRVRESLFEARATKNIPSEPSVLGTRNIRILLHGERELGPGTHTDNLRPEIPRLRAEGCLIHVKSSPFDLANHDKLALEQPAKALVSKEKPFCLTVSHAWHKTQLSRISDILLGSSDFCICQRRALRRGGNSFLVRKYSELCVRHVFLVNASSQ
jgi:hypothetical protein